MLVDAAAKCWNGRTPLDQTLIIRKPLPHEDRAIADLYLEARAEALGFLRQVHSEDETRAWISYVMLATLDVYVAEISGTIAGFIAMKDEEIEQLYLSPRYFRKGIGRGLIAHARTLQPQRLALHCFADNNRARAFYEQMGFQAISFGDGSGNEEGVPDIRYEWRAP